MEEKSLRRGKQKILIQFNDAISTFQPLKTRDLTLHAHSFKRIIRTKSRKQSHSSLCHKYSGVSRSGLDEEVKTKKRFWIVNERHFDGSTFFFIILCEVFLSLRQ